MSCNCSKAKNSLACVTNLTLGVAAVSTGYYAVFKSPTGGLVIFDVTSDSSGNVIVSSPGLRLNTLYEVWISLKSLNNIETKTAFTVGGTANVSCFTVIFDKCVDASTNANLTITNQTIKLS